MVSLDQVLLLEEKVESAVAKIAQLKAENDALRAKCAELTNALAAKTEQISSFQADQSRIEEGIIKALTRLNAVENFVLQEAGAPSAVPAAEGTQPEAPAEDVPSAGNTAGSAAGETAAVQESAPAAEPVPQAAQTVTNIQVVVNTPDSSVITGTAEVPAQPDAAAQPDASAEPQNEEPAQSSSDLFNIF